MDMVRYLQIRNQNDRFANTIFRSLLYYVFLAVMTIFANILRNSQQPTAKDDLQSLNMAATFFATLVPADGPCNYARYMTRMSTTFERIARVVFEREQKTVKPGPDAKSKLSKPDIGLQPPSQQSSISAPNTHSTSTTAVNIPNLEGLPPINSSGYVVRDSPTPSSPRPVPTNTNKTLSDNSPPSNPIRTPRENPQHPSNRNINHYQPQPTPFPASTMNMNMSTNIDMAFPLPALEETTFTFPQPELWQIPLTADWEFGFGGHFLSNMFGHPGNINPSGSVGVTQGQNYLFLDGGDGNVTGPTTTAAATPVPVSSVPMMDGTGAVEYGHGNATGTVGHGGASNTHPPTMWMDRNFGGNTY